MLRSRLECHKLSDLDCSERRAAFHQRCSDLRQSRSLGGTCRLRSAKRLRFSMPRVIPYGRLGVASGGLARQSPESLIAMQPPTAAQWLIGRRPPVGPVPGSAMDESLEPRADCPALADRLPG